MQSTHLQRRVRQQLRRRPHGAHFVQMGVGVVLILDVNVTKLAWKLTNDPFFHTLIARLLLVALDLLAAARYTRYRVLRHGQ